MSQLLVGAINILLFLVPVPLLAWCDAPRHTRTKV
jgi:hypothetical protein